jgi:hypothetical protein
MLRNTRGKAQEELCAPVVLTSVFVIFRYTSAWHPNVVCTSGSVDAPMLAKAQAHPVPPRVMRKTKRAVNSSTDPLSAQGQQSVRESLQGQSMISTPHECELAAHGVWHASSVTFPSFGEPQERQKHSIQQFRVQRRNISLILVYVQETEPLVLEISP